MTAAAPIPTDLKSTLEAMRAAVAAEGARRGLAGTIQGAILRILGTLLAIVEDFRAGRLAPVAPVAPAAPVAEPAGNGADGAVADRYAGLRRSAGAKNGTAGAVCRRGGEVRPWAHPSPSRCAGPSPRVKPGGKPAVGSQCAERNGGPIKGGGESTALCRVATVIAGAAEGGFFENAALEEGSGVRVSFQLRNKAAMA